MTAVAAAVAATVAMWDEGSDDEMSDGALYVWGADEHGSDLEDDPPEDDDAVPPPPPAAAGPGPKSVQERVRDMWDQYMLDHKIKNAATDPSSTHFAPWAPVGVVLGLRVREPFQGKAGMKQRIRPERLNTDSVTELECFEKMFSEIRQKKSALQAAGIPDKGDFVYAQTIDPDMPLTAILWHDSGPALFLSSFHDGETGAVLRREAGKSGRTQVQAPKAASDYNAYMCGCDTADQKRAQGSVMAKTYKWYIALFHWLLDQCVTNACVLWACENRGFQEDGSLDQPRTRRFRLALAEQLVVKAGLDLHMSVNDPQVSTYRVRASTGSDMVAYEQTLAKLKPERLLDNDHYVDCHNLWKEHCVLRAKDPTHKMPRKWNCVLCWALTGK